MRGSYMLEVLHASVGGIHLQLESILSSLATMALRAAFAYFQHAVIMHVVLDMRQACAC
jgi:hypothetical protein